MFGRNFFNIMEVLVNGDFRVKKSVNRRREELGVVIGKHINIHGERSFFGLGKGFPYLFSVGLEEVFEGLPKSHSSSGY